jgi:hypothetical protein
MTGEQVIALTDAHIMPPTPVSRCIERASYDALGLRRRNL